MSVMAENRDEPNIDQSNAKEQKTVTKPVS